ncbi:MAG: V-type ATP synthase subunit I [Bacillota bacterium]
MKKVLLVAPVSDISGVAKVLQDLGVLEVVKTEEFQTASRPQEVPEQDALDEKLAELKYCIDFFDRFQKVKKSLVQQFAGGKIPLAETRFQEYGSLDEEGHRIYEQCRKLDEELSGLGREETRLLELLRQLEPWEWLNVPLAEISQERTFSLILCEIPLRAFSGLQAELAESFSGVYVERGPSGKRTVPAAVVCLAPDRQEVLDALTKRGAVPSQLPALAGTPREEIRAAREGLSHITSKREEVASQINLLLAERVKILSLYDNLSLKRERHLLACGCPATRSAFAMEGWVREDDLPALERVISSRFNLVHIESRDPVDGEVPPVVLDNPGIVSPFEAVTEIYSLPQRGSVDPTFALAPFFFIFFGIALGDVGYGLGLTALSVLLLKKVRMAGLAKKLFVLIAMCGVSSAIVGVLTGGWLGNLVKIPPLWFNPMENPMLMLGVSFALGIIHIYVGLGIKFYSNIKRGKFLDGLFDQGFWYVFLTGLLLLLGGSGLKSGGLVASGKWLALGGAAGLILTQGRAHKNLLKRLGSGFLSLYGITGYLGDVLSYSRLLALGLASTVIAIVIDDMAVRMLGIPLVGWIPMILLLAVGHVFNLAINVIGAYVHSSRLQYVEFFSKFFEGGGRRFLPFRKRTRYIEVIEEGEA